MIMALKIESDKGPQHELAPELSQRLVLSHLADLFEKGLPKKARELMKDETATRQEVALALYRDLGKNARVAKQSGETAIRTLPNSSGASISIQDGRQALQIPPLGDSRLAIRAH
jgi:hypothetical protein